MKQLIIEEPQGRNRNEIIDCLQRWGHAPSIALLDSACKIFSLPSIKGIIGYRVESKCAIVFGDPVCPSENKYALMQAFHDFAENNFKNVIYLAASEEFVQKTNEENNIVAIEVGHEIVLNPMQDILQAYGKKASNLRNKYNQALRNNIIIKEYIEYDQQLEEEIVQIKNVWLKNRKGPQVCLLHIDLFAGRSNKRWFYAQYKGEIIGVLMLNRIDAHQGWVVNIMMLKPDAPKFTSECMILTAMATLRKEQCNFLSIGTLPSGQLGKIIGLSKITVLCSRFAFKILKKIFQLDGRQRYWEKFYPHKRSSFLLCIKSRLGLREIVGIMRALNVNV